MARIPIGVFNMIRLRYPQEFIKCLLGIKLAPKSNLVKQQTYSTVAVLSISPTLPTYVFIAYTTDSYCHLFFSFKSRSTLITLQVYIQVILRLLLFHWLNLQYAHIYADFFNSSKIVLLLIITNFFRFLRGIKEKTCSNVERQ